MKNLKILLPMLAFIFAIGVAFAIENVKSDPSTDYVLIEGQFQSIGMELNCEPGNQSCKAQLQSNGKVYDVYDAADINTLKPGDGTVNRVWE